MKLVDAIIIAMIILIVLFLNSCHSMQKCEKVYVENWGRVVSLCDESGKPK